jgi:hypothetical protein
MQNRIILVAAEDIVKGLERPQPWENQIHIHTDVSNFSKTPIEIRLLTSNKVGACWQQPLPAFAADK